MNKLAYLMSKVANKEDLTPAEQDELIVLMEQVQSGSTWANGIADGPSGIAGAVIKTGSGNIIQDETGLKLYDDSSGTSLLTGWLQLDGDWFVGSNLASADTTSLSIFSNAQTYNSESMGAGDVLFGSNSSGYANMLWDMSAKQLKFRGGTTVQAYVGTDGNIVFGGGYGKIGTEGLVFLESETHGAISWKDTGDHTIGYIYSHVNYGDPAYDVVNNFTMTSAPLGGNYNCQQWTRCYSDNTTYDNSVGFGMMTKPNDDSYTFLLGYAYGADDANVGNFGLTPHQFTVYRTFPTFIFKVDIDNANISINGGQTINEFSTDGTFAGNSDTAVPTEKACKTYADTKQTADATLASLAALGTAANKMAYTTGVDTWAEADITAAGRAILDDATAAAQIATLGAVATAISVTKTVKSAGGDYTTIQGAIDFFASKFCTDCIINVDAGTYSENIVVSNYLSNNPSGLTIAGDTRTLAGTSFVDGASCNVAAVANGGSGTVALSNLDETITVTGSTTSPDFDADGWVSGDKVIIQGDATNPTEYTIASTANNVITLTVTAPAVGADGTSIALKPNRIITSATSTAVATSNVIFKGFYVTTSATNKNVWRTTAGWTVFSECLFAIPTGNNQPNVVVSNNGIINVGSYASGAVTFDKTSTALQLGALTASSCAWRAGQSIAEMRVYNTAAINCSIGYSSTGASTNVSRNVVAALCTTAFNATNNAYADFTSSYVRGGTTGFLSQYNSYMLATSTSAKNSAGTGYSPSTTDTEGNVYAIITFT